MASARGWTPSAVTIDIVMWCFIGASERRFRRVESRAPRAPCSDWFESCRAAASNRHSARPASVRSAAPLAGRGGDAGAVRALSGSIDRYRSRHTEHGVSGARHSQILSSGDLVPVTARKHRELAAALILSRDRAVSRDALMGMPPGEHPPPSARKLLQVLRGPGSSRAHRGPSGEASRRVPHSHRRRRARFCALRRFAWR